MSVLEGECLHSIQIILEHSRYSGRRVPQAEDVR